MPEFGFLNCNKPPGMTSRDVVNVVQRRIRPVKVGHAGTLDPLAEGVLVLGVGPAVRLVPYVQQQPKHYFATFRLGQSSVSGDLEGELTEHPELPKPTLKQLLDAAVKLTGTIRQVPPAHSAIWVDGKRAYKRIRAGEDVDMPSREVVIESLQIRRYDFPEIDVDIVCGSGTYIRTLGFDLAKLAGSVAVMSYLQRTAVGEFELRDAVSLQQLRDEPIETLLLSPAKAVSQLAKIVVDDSQCVRLGHGLSLQPERIEPVLEETAVEAAAVTDEGRLRAIVRQKHGAWYPYRVFPLDEPSAGNPVR